jgi:sulfoxide reductase catalytic subunit YedY
MHYIRRPDWTIPESRVTPESVYLDRRTVLAGMGFAGLGLGLAGQARAIGPDPGAWPGAAPPAEGFAHATRPVTPEETSARYNNFYEFGTNKQIYDAAQALETEGWTIDIDGLVEKPFTIAVDDLIAEMPMEERIVRHRCVEAWSMVVPWIGFELSRLVERCSPLGSARFIRFETFLDADVARGQRQFWYPWPYVEGCTMAEAMHPLSFMVVGAYGKILRKQYGAPIRLHQPWKYGFKHIKSIRKISFTDQQPVSFWEELQASEYGFWANVNPEVDHPRWSQASERDIGTGETIPTQLFNGYAEQVASLYDGMEAELGDRLWR